MRSPAAMVVAAAVALAVAATAGCTRERGGGSSADPNAVMQDYIGYVDQLAVILERIGDEKAAAAAVGELLDLNLALARSKAKLDRESARTRDRLEYRYEDQLRSGRLRVNQEAVRLLSKQPTAVVLRDAMATVAKLIQ